jgi:CBS domain-containing protein
MFRDIPAQVLTVCLTRAEEIHLLKDELIFCRNESYHKGIYFVLSGAVRMYTPEGSLNLTTGNAIGISTFLGKTMYTMTAVADVDSSVAFIDEYSIHNLMDRVPEFRDRFMHAIMSRINELKSIPNRSHPVSMYQSVASCMSSPLITLHNSKSLADAAKMMEAHNINALVITNRKHVLKGLLTSKDIIQRYLSKGDVSAEKVLAEDYANTDPLLLPKEYPVMETLAEMLRRGVRYAVIVHKNRPVGIVSKSDITTMLSSNSNVFNTYVSSAKTLEALQSVVDSLPNIVESMMTSTSIFRDLLSSLSTHHIMIQKQAFEIAKAEYKHKHSDFEPQIGNYCLLLIGSIARRELTLAKYQNHLLVLRQEVSDEDFAHYTALAKLFAETLESLGYAHHHLGMSLINPEMVRRIADWKEFISTNIHKSNETNIPYTRVLFDCDRFEGDGNLLWEFKDCIYSTLKEKTLLFGRMINCQRMAKIPVSQFGTFITEKDSNTVDLKANALDFISYTAQTFALSADLLDINTARRIERLSHTTILSDLLTRETISAYESLIDLILHEQLNQIKDGQIPSSRIDPSKLSMHTQERLKRSLNLAARFLGEGLAKFK